MSHLRFMMELAENLLSVSSLQYIRSLQVWAFDGWLVNLGLTVPLDSISVYMGPSPRDRKGREIID